MSDECGSIWDHSSEGKESQKIVRRGSEQRKSGILEEADDGKSNSGPSKRSLECTRKKELKSVSMDFSNMISNECIRNCNKNSG